MLSSSTVPVKLEYVPPGHRAQTDAPDAAESQDLY